jgi:dUTP pyrophosphatase
LFNFADSDFAVKAGDRVAQLIIEKYTRTEIEEVTEGDLDSTERGEGGFGSTGVQQIPSKKRDQPEGATGAQ